MVLTAEDVQKKLFTTVRLREGYETSEVDEFCEEVEAELTRLVKENDDLRAQLDGRGGSPAGLGADSRTTPAGVELTAGHEQVVPRTPPPQEIVVRTSEEVSTAAARVLEMAQRTADQYLTEVRAEADLLVTDAKSSAEKLSTDAQTKADAVDRETHERTTALGRELADQRRSTLERLQEEKRTLENEVETLRSFEREYRGRLRTFLEGQLGQLSAHATEDTPLAPAGGPSGVTSSELPGGDESLPSDSSTSEPPGASDHATDSTAESDRGVPARAESAEPDPAGGARAGGSTDGDGRDDSGPRSALGRILAEEERAAHDS